MAKLGLLQGKLTMPTLGKDVVERPLLHTRFQTLTEYAVTLVTAGAGYGKTTALVQYLRTGKQLVGWYSAGPEDDNIFSYSTYLAGALDKLAPGVGEFYLNQAQQTDKLDWKSALNFLLMAAEQVHPPVGKGILVIDDWQYVAGNADILALSDRLIACCPEWLHVVVSSREPVRLPELEKKRLRGEVLTIGPGQLMFRKEETEALFCLLNQRPPLQEQLEQVMTATSGWTIAVRLLAGQGQQPETPEQTLDGQEQLERLFEFLAQSVLEQQPEDLQQFLLKTSLVEAFTLSFCREFLDSDQAPQLAAAAWKKGLFMDRIGPEEYQYHTLFREFLRREARMRLPQVTELYGRIGDYYIKEGHVDRALPFWLQAGRTQQSAALLSEAGMEWVHSGRGKLFRNCWQQLPPSLQKQPQLLLALAEDQRYNCRYEQAIRLYEQAGQLFEEIGSTYGCSQIYRGIGEVYLDIIQPLQAQQFLRKAYKLLTVEQRTEKAALLGLMTENMINQGNSVRAKRYRRLQDGIDLRPSADWNNSKIRLLLRTGRLREVVQQLETQIPEEQKGRWASRTFRESSLILSLCYSYMGRSEQALQLARVGIEDARRFKTPFGEAVGHMRAGHALLLDYEHQAEACRQEYDTAMRMAYRLGILRGQTEVYQGLCLVQALEGNWPEAERMGRCGIAITEQVKDIWFTAVLYHTLGMAAALTGEYVKAENTLLRGLELFRKCRDDFGQAAGYWWLLYVTRQLQKEKERRQWQECLRLSAQAGYGFLLGQATLLGDITGKLSVDSGQVLLPVKVGTERQGSLRIESLGGLRVWRDGEEIPLKEWRRSGARQLLCLLLTLRAAPVSKDSLLLYLWPEADAHSASGNFRVVWNQLNNVLEPQRQARTLCRYLQRKNGMYQWDTSQNLYIDVKYFEERMKQGRELLHSQPEQACTELLAGMELYGGEYLAGESVDEISLRERERLARLALAGTEGLGQLYRHQKNWEQALFWSQRLLDMDSCWERGFQLQMECYGCMGNRVMLERTFQLCKRSLFEELNVEPSEQTLQIYEQYIKEKRR